MATHAHDRHTVQVYETDGYLADRVVEFISAGLRANERCVVVATRAHRDVIRTGLANVGIGVESALSSGDLTMLDAHDTLASFMVADVPDPLRFELSVGATIARATRDGRRVRAFGEMVDLLWREGHPEAALQLERLWNELARKHDFDLLCAYTMANLYKTSSSRFREVCELHDHVHPIEHSDSENAESARLLVAEVSRGAALERELRETIRALQRAEDLERVRTTRAVKLQQATAALAGVVSFGELADTILSQSRQLTSALAAATYIADSEGRFRMAGQLNLQHLPARLEVTPLDGRPIARTLATGEAQWIENRESLFDEFPKLLDSGIIDPRAHAVATLPFLHRDKVIGGIGLAFETQRTFSEEERAWLLGFAAQCALAIDRVNHYTAEQKARTDAENLLRIAESLNAAHLDLEAVLQKVTDEATALVGAQYGAFVYSALTTVTNKESRLKLGLPRAIPQAPLRSDEPSRLEIPVRSRSGGVIGALFLGHDEAAKFTTQHEAVLRSLAVTAAIAIDNAELYQATREAEDAQRRSVEQLVDTVRMNELFTGVLAHDLRSPIAAVTTAAELLIMKSGDYEKKVLSRVLGSARRMARMIEQLLDFTRIRVGTGLPLDTKPCDLQQVLAHVVDELRAARAKQPIELTVAGDTKGQWDEDRLAQALSNLIGNAAQHGTTERGVSVHLDGTQPSVVRVKIHNEGSIPEELLPRIFEPMIGGKQRRDGTRGLGLGLFITREIASAHGGTVLVESRPEIGTTFTLCIPREVASVEPVRREPQPAATAHEPGLDIGQRMRVLVDGAREHAIFLLDEHGNVQTWNATAERITRCSRAEAMNRPFEIDLTRATKLGSSEEEMLRTRRDGTTYWAEVAVSAIRSPSNDLVGFTVVLRDVSELREARAKLEDNEARLHRMIDSVRDYAIFLLDTEGKVATWNRGAQIAKGYTQGEIIGRHISTFYTREDREAGRPQMLLQRAIDEGRVEDEGWRVRKDGARFWADVVITALRDEHGQLRGFTKVTRDLTERRRADEELRRSEERFRLLVDSVKDYAIFMLDPTGRVMTWNAGAERAKGYKAHEIVGEHFSKFYDPEEVRAGKCERELEIAIRDGRFEEEGWRIRKDGTRFWANVVITMLRSSNGEVVGFAKVTRDLTERRSLEEQRMRTIQAQEGIRLRDEFLSIVSHELKTPLAGLLLQIDAIALRGLDEGTRVKIARARESGMRLDNLIETLLDVSRIATGRFVLGLESFDLADLIRSTVDSFAPSATKAGCEMIVTLPEKLPGRWDRVRMAQVIANLLSNAIKYGAGAVIEIRAERVGHDVAIHIRDHGPGVDPTTQSRIFDRFERAASTWHYAGLGIGLYVVREIVTAHGGSVGVENSPDGGARFTVRLPMETTA